MAEYVCTYCGERFTTMKDGSLVIFDTGLSLNFCSRKCYSEYNIGEFENETKKVLT